MNLFHYVEMNGSYSFLEKPFNEVDNVIFSLLSYLPLQDIVGGFEEKPVSLEFVTKQLIHLEKQQKIQLKMKFYKKIYKLTKEMSKTNRYRDILLYNYWSVIDQEKQFGAVTIKLPDNSIYISYEGTDTTLIGWEEDANMTYCFPVPSQKLSSIYLKKTLHRKDTKVRLGGHSKGGNLAIYAAMMAPSYLEKNIVAIYTNDGPGFIKKEIESKKYQKISPKVHKLVPKESMIGMLLYHNEEVVVIKSKGKRFFQHYPFQWQIEGDSFVKDTLSSYSIKVSERTKEWLENINDSKHKKCIKDLFCSFAKAEVIDTYDFFSIGKTVRVVKNIKKIETDSKKNLWEVVKAIM